jgi:glycosyltransferase involved in cell wall biosynthesis
MVKVLLVISSLEPSGPARALVHLAAGLPRRRIAVRVLVLGHETPWCAELRQAGVGIDVLGWRWPFDYVRLLNPFGPFHLEMAQEAPQVIHAWDPTAAWALVLGGACRPSRLRLSGVLTPGRPAWPCRWLVRHAGRVLALGEAEAAGYRRLGVSPSRLTTVAPGVPLLDPLPAPASLPELPSDARVVLCLGPLARHKGYREAAWALDILRLIHPEAHLVIVGAGPAADSVRRLMASNRLHDCVHLAGPVADVGPWLARAEAVWVPSLRAGGRFAALEAMAAGRAVLASHLPALAEVVFPEQTGYLVAPGDKVALARYTRLLFDHPDLARQMGEAGRQRIAEQFRLDVFRDRVAAWLEES